MREMMRDSLIKFFSMLRLASRGAGERTPSCLLLMSLTWTSFVPPLFTDVDLSSITLPKGFSIALYARAKGVRSLALGDRGTVFAGTRDGSVYALVDADRDNRAERVAVIAEDLNSPNGVAFRDGDLYVAEIHRLIAFRGIEGRLDDPPEPEAVYEKFPTDPHHGWKYIAFDPKGRLYVPVGAPCNSCRVKSPYASILRFTPDFGEIEVYATGIRNTVGFDFHPETGELWFTNNGRDWMGDDLPPDSLNRAPEKGLDFGFPVCHSGVADPEFGGGADCGDFAPPALRLPAHVASLGMAFYTGTMFPESYRNQVFIAEHGSWNRSVPVGYRVTMARFSETGELGYETFASGWLKDGDAWGRPVDVLVMPDGALLISDDRADAVYRVDYDANRP